MPVTINLKPVLSVPPADWPPEYQQFMVKTMAERFLTWHLPGTFSPDGGISFQKVSVAGTHHEYENKPVGTNLFTYTEAEQMIRHMLGIGKPD